MAQSPADATVCLPGTRRDTLLPMKYFAWDATKNAKLRTERGMLNADQRFGHLRFSSQISELQSLLR
jgi:hypothetical protein